MCVGVGMEIAQAGNIEELFMHEGAHVTLDAQIYALDDWKCARDLDQNYISTYARDHPLR